MNLIIILAAILLSVSGYVYDRYGARPTTVPTEKNKSNAQTLAPDFKITDLSGQVHRLENFRGRNVLLHFWATWCPPCLEELPDLLRFSATQKNTTLIALSSDKSDDIIKKFLDRLPPKTVRDLAHKNIIVARDPGRAITTRLYGTDMYPETILIGPDGHIMQKWAGPQDWAQHPPL